ncbi:MAG: hypothetical protein AAFX09_04700 [Pseudomonadota bacterium]
MRLLASTRPARAFLISAWACLASALAIAAGPALAQAAPDGGPPLLGPHLTGGEYIAARGGFDDPVRVRWTRTVRPLGTDSGETVEQMIVAGPGYVFDESEGLLYDFEHRRLVQLNESGTLANSALHAEARRRLDIYAALSEGGRRDLIDFGAAGSFDRFWLEAAMGVRASASPVFETLSEDGRRQWRRDPATSPIASAASGACAAALAPGSQAAVLGWLRHAAPIHPDIFAPLTANGAPCSVSFVVYSPDSPDGREEIWTWSSAELALDFAPWPDDAQARLPGPDAILALSSTAAIAAARGEGSPPSSADFGTLAQARRSGGDPAGAYLVIARETAHFGPCPTQGIGSERMACAMANSVAAAGIGNPDFERVFDGFAALAVEDHARAVQALEPELTRLGADGAAARTLIAGEMIAWGREGLGAHPELDPGLLLAEALAMDPYAPDAYWHLGRRLLEAGAPRSAWAFFDLGRALPDREPTPLLAQVSVIEARIEAAMGSLFGETSAGEGETGASQEAVSSPPADEAATQSQTDEAPAARQGSEIDDLLRGLWPSGG